MQALEYPFDGEALLRKKRALRRELAAQPGLVEKRVAIVSGTTVGEVKNMLELFLLNSGIRPAFWEGPVCKAEAVKNALCRFCLLPALCV